MNRNFIESIWNLNDILFPVKDLREALLIKKDWQVINNLCNSWNTERHCKNNIDKNEYFHRIGWWLRLTFRSWWKEIIAKKSAKSFDLTKINFSFHQIGIPFKSIDIFIISEIYSEKMYLFNCKKWTNCIEKMCFRVEITDSSR